MSKKYCFITSKKGNYVLGKRNHRTLYNAVKQHIETQGSNNKNSLRDGFDDSHDVYTDVILAMM